MDRATKTSRRAELERRERNSRALREKRRITLDQINSSHRTGTLDRWPVPLPRAGSTSSHVMSTRPSSSSIRGEMPRHAAVGCTFSEGCPVARPFQARSLQVREFCIRWAAVVRYTAFDLQFRGKAHSASTLQVRHGHLACGRAPCSVAVRGKPPPGGKVALEGKGAGLPMAAVLEGETPSSMATGSIAAAFIGWCQNFAITQCRRLPAWRLNQRGKHPR
jgi:hypothetical protein